MKSCGMTSAPRNTIETRICRISRDVTVVCRILARRPRKLRAAYSQRQWHCRERRHCRRASTLRDQAAGQRCMALVHRHHRRSPEWPVLNEVWADHFEGHQGISVYFTRSPRQLHRNHYSLFDCVAVPYRDRQQLVLPIELFSNAQQRISAIRMKARILLQ